MYEFALVPRSMFAADGSMLRCSAKSALMAILEKLPSRSADQRSISDGTTTNAAQSHLKVFIIDGMAELQCLGQAGMGEELRAACYSLRRHNRTDVWQEG